ncbi:gephyrin-like molybdotransferase Glp [Nocardioides sp. SYSU D00038]|uniref:molybdotransferase-like divisome protein Glp n=1 Tax=Nocardioides sp. SYSU D00038 TaxID=2812554 RepID=UPI0019677A2D|nr:gephyrin-like molybdotransferase Glp [Nocardioides sp. SYSU D00038]
MADQPCTVEEHLARVLDGLEPLPAGPQPLLGALGLPAAADVRSPMRLPSFDNSAMDGYAVRHADVAAATEREPVVLPVVGEIGAGQAALHTLGPGQAAKIMTGAPVPEGADAVVPYEWTDRGTERVRVDRAPVPGQHVRPAGDDVREGDLLVAAGTLLTPRHLGLLASVGHDTVPARPRPRVVVISTGSELRDPGQPLGHDSIYDGNSWLLAAAAQRAGAVAVRAGIVSDDPEEFRAALHARLDDADLVVTSGGVSMGDYDVVKAALAPEGVWFGPVAMQPGKPQGFGRLGPRRVPVVTLPGNPVSSYISFELFVRPALRRLVGRTPELREPVPARLTGPVTSPPGRRQYLRGDLDRDGDVTVVAPVGGSGSHLVGDLARANALIVVPEATTALEAGTTVDVLPIDEDY